jgi:hypothetical protein
MIVPVDLPDKLLQRVQASAREQGVPFREFVAGALEAAVAEAGAKRPASRVFSQCVHDFGAHLESVWTVLAELETDEYTGRKSK